MKKNKESTKSLILQSASSLFQRQGYHGTGVNQIIEESGAPKGSLYYHFPNGKEEIAEEAISLMKKYVASIIQQDFDQDKPIVELFQSHINKIAAFFDQQESIEGLEIGLIASETALTHDKLRYACQSTYQAWQELYTSKLLEAGFEKNKAQEISLTVNAMIEGAIILAKIYQNGEPIRIIANQMPLLLNQSQQESER